LHDPARLAANINPSSDLAIYFDCGLQDQLLLYPFNTAFAESLNALGLKYVFQSFEGTHTNKFYSRLPIALAFIDSVMKKSTGIFVEHKNSQSSFSLNQNYPNPFNPSTTIEFALPKPAFVTLKIFNLLGKEVATLVAEQRSVGIHKMNWDAHGLASGVYLCRLKAGDFVQSKKLILMR
jgi:hypothetical protein